MTRLIFRRAALSAAFMFATALLAVSQAHAQRAVSVGVKVMNPAVSRGLNPQPEPPSMVRGGPTNPLVLRGFNPQPEPPRSAASTVPQSPAQLKGFNPQPDPPVSK